MQKIHQQACHVVHMYELKAPFIKFLAARKYARQTLSCRSHACRPWAVAQWSTPQRTHHVILHGGAREDVWPEDVGAAITHALGAIAHHLVTLTHVDRVRKRVCPKREVFHYRPRGLRAVGGDAAGKDELADMSTRAIDDTDGFHDPRCAGYVDLPHALNIENSGALRFDHEREMYDGTGAGVPKQLREFAA